VETIEYDIDIEFQSTKNAAILLETKPGCSKTNFKFKDGYFELEHSRDYFVASDNNELQNFITNYFELDFLNKIDPEYFDDNYIVIILFEVHDSDILTNEHFDEKDNKYNFILEVWDRGNPFLWGRKCIYEKLYVIQIPKNNNYLMF
jgi:hypothetical protein